MSTTSDRCGDMVTMSSSKTIDRTLVGWSKALRRVGLGELASSFDTDAKGDFSLVRGLGLPCYEAYFLPVADFLERFVLLKEQFVFPSYYLQLYPIDAGDRKHSLVDFDSLDTAREFIYQSIDGRFDKYSILISEFETNVWGGTIMSYKGGIVVEIAGRLQTGVSYGSEKVELMVISPILPGPRFSTREANIRSLLLKGAKAIAVNPTRERAIGLLGVKSSSANGVCYMDGYFEFAYTRASNRERLRLVVLDAKLNEAYYEFNCAQLYDMCFA